MSFGVEEMMKNPEAPTYVKRLTDKFGDTVYACNYGLKFSSEEERQAHERESADRRRSLLEGDSFLASREEKSRQYFEHFLEFCDELARATHATIFLTFHHQQNKASVSFFSPFYEFDAAVLPTLTSILFAAHRVTIDPATMDCEMSVLSVDYVFSTQTPSLLNLMGSRMK